MSDHYAGVEEEIAKQHEKISSVLGPLTDEEYVAAYLKFRIESAKDQIESLSKEIERYSNKLKNSGIDPLPETVKAIRQRSISGHDYRLSSGECRRIMDKL